MDGVTGIGHVAIRARDLDALLAFYTAKLGFQEMFRLNNDDGSLMLVYVRVTAQQFLEFFPRGTGEVPAASNVGYNHLCLTVADIEATLCDLEGRGVPLARGLQTGRDGNRQAWIADPEGNRIELMEMAPNSKQAEALARLAGV
jgi:lactoylglutathione lyase